ncbi:Bardet-Biedl syndrome 2 protein, variant 2 [Dermatophagoides farinae]|uniref:Bardet-Biedl syndrome 2 protein, variant 2 n=1 Tax=Dermatophagoides farinae TaxID=6954 RepID=A0A922L7F8_DERFA|nr:Bardet-Biedl syndrome 2 protein, variant 2 [Dermatophagoides farinae]
MPMLNCEFIINLSEPIKPDKVNIGYFDGIHPSIVAVTRSDKIFVHNPHNRSLNDPYDTQQQQSKLNRDHPTNDGSRLAQHTSSTIASDLNFLNINQTITCLAAGSISSLSLKDTVNDTDLATHTNSSVIVNTSNKKTSINSAGSGRKISLKTKNLQKQANNKNNDILIVGTKTSIHAYDILHNTDLYYKEIPDGANTLVIGEFGQILNGSKLALIGGNCAIHGFDREGHDTYWMVTGDNITAMALVDIDSDQQNELVVGSQDCEIQVFKKDAIICEMSETDCVTHLCPLGPTLFAYALANGTVGVYQNKERVWRIKSKNQAMTLFGADINNNGQMELLTGWSNGKLDIRIAMTGEVLYRENYKCSIAGIMIADYNMDGKDELIVCTVSGDVYGYRMENQEERHQQVNFNIEQDTIRDLMKRKQTLMQELRNYEENARIQNLADPLVMNKGKVLTEKGDHFGAIPASTKLRSSLILQSCDDSLPDFIELRLETTNNTRIRAAIIFAEGIFKHESIVIYPPESEALVGFRSSTHYHVFELSRRLPRFSMYSFIRIIYIGHDETDQLKLTMPSNNNITVDDNRSKIKQRNDKIPKDSKPFWRKNFSDNLQIKGLDDESPLFEDDDNLKKYYDQIDDIENHHYMMNEDANFDSMAINAGYNESVDVMSMNQNTFQQSSIATNIEVRQPSSYVAIRINEQIGNLVEWITANFLLDLQSENNEEERRFEFISLRDQSGLIIELTRISSQNKSQSKDRNNGQKIDETYGEEYYHSDIMDPSTETSDSPDLLFKSLITIYSESIEVAGNCIQSLGDHFKIINLPCYRASFLDEINKLRQLVDRVEEIQNVRQHLVVEVADNANMIRSAVVQAEDARLTEQYHQMKQIYNDLGMMNKDIMREYQIRCQNHQDLVDSLKQINIIIQRASNLRIGSYKTAFINSCRESIKQKNFSQLFKIINED